MPKIRSTQIKNVTGQTGTGDIVFATSPSLIAPALGTPASGVMTNVTGLPTTGLVDGAVTLAKMADLAQDQFIGRTTASTGVPQTATITAAARTVLDDTTVSAMVDTLGGATSTGTGGLVRNTAPQISTIELGHASDTTLSRVSAGVVAVEGKTLANLTDGGTFLADVSVPDEAYGSGWNGSTEVPTKNAIYDKIETLGGATKCLITSNFETSARYTQTTTGSGSSATFDTTGCSITTSNSSQGSIKVVWSPGGNGMLLFANSPKFTTNIVLGTLGGFSATTTGSLYMGIGDITVGDTSHTFTNRHIGFKVLYSGGNHTLFATQADGTTENASSALTTFSGSFGGDILELICIVNGTTSVDYYWRKNGGSLSSVTTLTGNVPSGSTNGNAFQWSAQNGADATRYGLSVQNFSYER